MSALALRTSSASAMSAAVARFLSTPIAASSAVTRFAPTLSALPGVGALIGGINSLLELLPPVVLAVPKHKTTHSRKSMRSANKGIKNKTNFTNCPACGAPKLAHNLCPNCYSQITRRWKREARGEEIIENSKP